MKRTHARRSAWLGALALAGATAVVTVMPQTAAAHGGLTFPATRTYACYEEAVRNGSGGGLNPQNEMCQQLLAENGNYPFYNWFGNLLSDADGRHREVVPDGLLCGPGPQFSGVNRPGNWPTTNVQAGQTVTFQYNAWARHPGRWDQYITKDGWDPSQPLAWDDLEPVPFDSVTNPPIRSGGPEGDEYYWQGTLPNKTGQHIIYSIWTRSDSPEAFYNCSDVNFGGTTPPPPPPPPVDTQAPSAPGAPAASDITETSATLAWAASTDDVGVTGYTVRDDSGTAVATSTTTSVTVTGLSPDTSYTFTVVARDAAGNVSASSPAVTFLTGGEVLPPPPPPAGDCTAELTVANSWPGGYQASVTVTAGDAALTGWSTTLPDGVTATQVWSGTRSGQTVSNAAWNGNLGAGQSTSYGFIGSGSAPAAATLTCSTA